MLLSSKRVSHVASHDVIPPHSFYRRITVTTRSVALLRKNDCYCTTVHVHT